MGWVLKCLFGYLIHSLSHEQDDDPSHVDFDQTTRVHGDVFRLYMTDSPWFHSQRAKSKCHRVAVHKRTRASGVCMLGITQR